MPMLHGSRIKLFSEMALNVENSIFFSEVESLLSQGESVTIKVRGCSMMPWLRDGKHSVVVRRHVATDVKVGVVMFYVYRGQWLMHRLRKIDGDKLYFAGDGNYRQWEIVGLEALRGVVVSIISPVGRVMKCESGVWRFKSCLWLTLPAIVRRYILAIVRRLKL